MGERSYDAGYSGTRLNITIENIRRRWYEVSFYNAGVNVSPRIFLIGPSNREGAFEKQIEDILVIPGSNLSLFANGESLSALGMHAIDLVLIAVTGNPIPANLVDLSLGLLSLEDDLFGFSLTLGARLAQGDVIGALSELQNLPNLAANAPQLRSALQRLGVSTEQLSVLGTAAWVIKLIGIIIKEVETLTSPRFDSMQLIVK